MTLWQAPARSDAASAAHAAAEADRAARPERYDLDPDRVAGVAAKRHDIADFAPGWREGLEQYPAEVEDGKVVIDLQQPS